MEERKVKKKNIHIKRKTMKMKIKRINEYENNGMDRCENVRKIMNKSI